MALFEEIVSQLGSLTPDGLADLAHYVEYLQWKQSSSIPHETGIPWTFDFVEHFNQASIAADGKKAGMDVQIGEAACDGDWRMALWQHPPIEGAASIEYQVPVPTGVGNLHLECATGIRDGAQLAQGNVVGFRIFVNDWRIWNTTQNARRWKTHLVPMPSVSGDIVRIRFVTDGLGNHQWAWAAWAEPRLVGDINA